jgi:hypothetical protein
MSYTAPILGLDPTEYEECVTLADYLRYLQSTGKIIAFAHIPQETYTKYRGVKTRNKMMGVTRGLPDYMIVTAKPQLIFVEMKRVSKSKVSPFQIFWIRVFKLIGVPAEVCKGFDEAKVFIDKNL